MNKMIFVTMTLGSFAAFQLTTATIASWQKT